MIKLIRVLTFVCVFIFGSAFLFAGAAGQADGAPASTELPQVEAQLAHSSNPGGAAGAAAFKQYVERESNGRFVINTIDYQALGSVRDVVDQVRLGEMEITAVGTEGISHVWPDLQMVGVPFIFTDRDVFWALMKDTEYVSYIRDNILASSRNTIRYLGAAENSVRHLYSNKPIRVPQDMTDNRIKIRIQESPIMQAVFTGLGAGEIVAMSGSERDAAIQSGALDAIEGSFGGAWKGGNLARLGHATLTGHVYDYMHYFVNNDYYQTLPAEYQAIIDGAVIVAIDAHNKAALESDEVSIEAAKTAGVWVYQPTSAELKLWQDRAIPAGERFVEAQVSSTFRALTRDTIARLTRELGR